MQKSKDFLNWGTISRHLAGNRASITRSRIPKKHEPKIQELINFVNKWKNASE